MSRFVNVAAGVGWRSVHHFVSNPAFLLPALVFPLFFFTAFAGGLSGIDRLPEFDFPSGYTAFQYVFVLLQASAFGGVFTGFAIAADYESGFTRRMFLAAPHRFAIIVGYALAALARAVAIWVLLTTVALLTGMRIDGSAGALIGLFTLALLLNVTAVLFAAGVASRLRTMQAGPAMQMPVFFLLFLAPVYVPLELLDGWIKAAASANPLTPLLETGRDFISGSPASLMAYAVVGAMLAAMAAWAVTGLRRAEAVGG